MTSANQSGSQVLEGARARNLAPWTALASITGMLFVTATLVAVWVSWPLGPGFVDEGGITQIRLAVAFLGFALMGAVRLQRLEDQSLGLPEKRV